MSRVVGVVSVLLALGVATAAVAEDESSSVLARRGGSILLADEAQGEAKAIIGGSEVEELRGEPAAEVQTLGSERSRYQTWGRLRGRASNIELAASKLDGVTVQPGEVFSFNDIVGDRTIANGFRMAPVIRNGELDRGIGGGVCQVAGTLFGAAYRAGLDVLEHEHHTWPSTYVPRGLDATVVYGAADLRLQNPYSFPVTFHVTTDHAHGRLTVTVDGAGTIPEVVVSANTVREMAAPVRSVEDPTVPAGETVVEHEGRTGYWVRVTRSRGGVEDAEAVHYPEAERVVRIGTGPATNVVVASAN